MCFPLVAWVLAYACVAHNLAAQPRPENQWLPVIITGDGFRTTIELVNSTREDQDVSLSASDPDGVPVDIFETETGQSDVLSLVVDAGGSRLIETVSDSGARAGYVAIEGRILVEAVQSVDSNVEAARASRLHLAPAAPTRKAVFSARSGDGSATEIAVLALPDNPAPARIHWKAIAPGGAVRAEAELAMAPGRMGFVSFHGLFPGVGSFEGTLEMAAEFPVVMQPFRKDDEFTSTLRALSPRPDPVRSNNCGEFSAWDTSNYVLPYPVDAGHRVNQGNCSGFGHSGFWRYGYDFVMDIGTSVTAAREGIVITTNENVADGNRSGTNLITVRHDDGTVALYSHLTRNGVLVEPGERVEAGQRIGRSGDTGNTGGLPHLHFSLHSCASLPGLPGSANCPTIPVTFRNTNANPHGLQRQRIYTADEF